MLDILYNYFPLGEGKPWKAAQGNWNISGLIEK